MQLNSLGHRSDLIFTKFDGEVTDRGSYLVVKTLTNPNYFWGNLLIFNEVPKRGDLLEWKTAFRSEFQDPRIYHMTFAWDSSEIGDISEFLAEGFTLEKGVVLAATSVHLPEKNHSGVVVRPVESDEDWERSIQIAVACGDDRLSKEQWEGFYRSQIGRYRKMVSAGMGHWFGAYLDGLMVGSLGVFKEGSLGRFQLVSTHPDFQRRGICGTLVFKSAEFAFQEMGIETLVMIADEEYHAARIYESVGFKPVEKTTGVCWWDKARA